MSTAVATVRMCPHKYDKDFNAVVALLTPYIDKRAPTPSVKVAFVSQIRPGKRQKTSASYGSFKGKIELKKYSREKYDSMTTAQQQQLNDLQKKSELIRGKKTPKSNRALEARVASLEAEIDNSGNESLFADKKPKPITEISSLLTEKGAPPDRSMQTLDGQGCQKGTVCPAC